MLCSLNLLHQTFYEDVGAQSIYIRGAYFVGQSSSKNKFIDFFILDPANKVIFSKRKSEEGIFRFNTTQPGTYTFVFSNMKVIKPRYVLILNRTGEAPKTLLQLSIHLAMMRKKCYLHKKRNCIVKSTPNNMEIKKVMKSL